ncbi:hypothetical protein [Paraburkholderia megapolitana]|uniref:Uncharacterized protein n=1 Tax=Paraburkholderia megapolitana TaxID=420953 RepID=A0A1I3LRG6_9BURK|nr:hypothetical protein [Paraburkholderia megapolitana]QDQ80823.1 hypothetical protein FNZ07_06350 [Paraburkholderia megapolitana]SFI87273.1 hypothetical protein SAMN05192543_104539 [Paraburkholderia megapolitana]
MQVRAVVVAVMVGCFSCVTMAAQQYAEVWNPPEAVKTTKTTKTAKRTGGAARKIAKPTTTATATTKHRGAVHATSHAAPRTKPAVRTAKAHVPSATVHASRKTKQSVASTGATSRATVRSKKIAAAPMKRNTSQTANRQPATNAAGRAGTEPPIL